MTDRCSAVNNPTSAKQTEAIAVSFYNTMAREHPPGHAFCDLGVIVELAFVLREEPYSPRVEAHPPRSTSVLIIRGW